MTENQPPKKREGGEERPLECTSCKKHVAVRYTEVMGGVITHTVMCSDCPVLEMRLHGIPSGDFAESAAEAGLCCGNCGTTLNSVRSGSFLGCQFCYDVFGDVLVGELESMNKISQKLMTPSMASHLHVGRKPGEVTKMSPSNQLIALKEALDETLEREDYEQAAWIRDQIKELTEIEDDE